MQKLMNLLLNSQHIKKEVKKTFTSFLQWIKKKHNISKPKEYKKNNTKKNLYSNHFLWKSEMPTTKTLQFIGTHHVPKKNKKKAMILYKFKT